MQQEAKTWKLGSTTPSELLLTAVLKALGQQVLLALSMPSAPITCKVGKTGAKLIQMAMVQKTMTTGSNIYC